MHDMVSPRKRKEGMLRAWPQKKRKNKTEGVAMSKNNGKWEWNKREREPMQSGVSHIITHLIRTHAHLDLDCMTWFSMDSLFGYTTYEMKVCPILLPYIELHKSLIFSREEKEARTAQVRNHTQWVIQENHLRNLVLISKKFHKKTSRWIAHIIISVAPSTVLTLNNSR